MIHLIARILTLKFVLDGLRGRRGEATRPQPAPTRPASTRPPSTSVRTGPGSPLDLAPLEWKETAKRTLEEIKADRVTFVAAGMAYYWFLALFPAVIAAIGVLGLVDASHQTINSVESSVRSTLPAGPSDIIGDAIDNAGRPNESASIWAALIGIAVAVWSASSGMVALQKGLNVAYDIPEERKFLKARLVALVLIGATLLLGGVPSPIFTFGESTIFVVIGWVLTVGAVIVLFSLFYYLAPNRDSPRWTWVSAGGIAGALLWIVLSIGFVVYVNEFSSYGKTYGTMAGVVVMILWLFLTSLTVLIGGELNAELERQAAQKTARETGRRAT